MDDLDELLGRAAPSVDVEHSAFAARQLALAVARRRRFFAWPRWRVAVGAVGALLVPAAAVAGVLHFGVLTGRFGSAGKTENDTSQFINMCAPGIGSYVAKLSPDALALAPGATWAAERAMYLKGLRSSCPPHGPGLVMQATGIRSDLLLRGTCTWEGWALGSGAAVSDVGRADRHLAAMTRAVARVQLGDGRTGISAAGWRTMERDYSHASRGYLSHDYEVNCLGHNTTATSRRRGR